MQEQIGAPCAAAARDIFVVEDEVLVRMLIADVLETAGLPIHEAGDAEAALADLTGRDAPPCVLVTDINLGSGMDGVTFAALMQQRWPGLPVVYVTANPDRLGSRPLRPNERLVPKPFDIDSLADAVRSVLPLAYPG